MADCVYIQGCIFFNDKMASMPQMANLYKERYCRTDSSNCARYMVCTAMGRDKVPSDLYPNDTERAQQLINS